MTIAVRTSAPYPTFRYYGCDPRCGHDADRVALLERTSYVSENGRGADMAKGDKGLHLRIGREAETLLRTEYSRRYTTSDRASLAGIVEECIICTLDAHLTPDVERILYVELQRRRSSGELATRMQLIEECIKRGIAPDRGRKGTRTGGMQGVLD